jgi:hypothetical protein
MRVLAFDIGSINFAYCLVEMGDEPPRVVSMGKRTLGASTDCMSVLIDSMQVFVESLSEVCTPPWERVIIEQQNGRTAPKNFALSTALYSYYQRLAPGRVVFVNPRVKFTRLAQRPEMESVRAEILDTRGAALKNLTVKCATMLAETWGCPVAAAGIRGAIKKDDVSDALLMAATFDSDADAAKQSQSKKRRVVL